MDPAAPTDLPLVRIADGLLRCPHCDSYDLMPVRDQVLACDDCHRECARFADQCVNCGARGAVLQEVLGRSAPGQRPSEAPRKLVTVCESCGYTTR